MGAVSILMVVCAHMQTSHFPFPSPFSLQPSPYPSPFPSREGCPCSTSRAARKARPEVKPHGRTNN